MPAGNPAGYLPQKSTPFKSRRRGGRRVPLKPSTPALRLPPWAEKAKRKGVVPPRPYKARRGNAPYRKF